MLDPIQIAVKGREGIDMLGLCRDGVFVTLKGREGLRGTGRGRWVVSVRSIRCRVLVVDGVVLLRVQDVQYFISPEGSEDCLLMLLEC